MLRPYYIVLIATAALAADSLVILPKAVTLTGAEALHQLLAEAAVADHEEDWTRSSHWVSSNPAIVTVDQTGQLKPVSDGQATVTATAEGRTAIATISVKVHTLRLPGVSATT